MSIQYVLSSKNTEYSAPRVGAHVIYDYSYEYVLSSKNTALELEVFLDQEYILGAQYILIWVVSIELNIHIYSTHMSIELQEYIWVISSKSWSSCYIWVLSSKSTTCYIWVFSSKSFSSTYMSIDTHTHTHTHVWVNSSKNTDDLYVCQCIWWRGYHSVVILLCLILLTRMTIALQ